MILISGGIEFGIDEEIHFHGLDPAYRICRVSGEVSGESHFKLGVDDDIGVGGLGGAEAEGTGLLEVDCLLIPKGWVGTVGVKDVGKGLGLMGWLLWSHSLGLLPNGLSQIFSFHLILSD